MVLTETDAQTVRPYRSRFRGSAHQTTGFTTRRPDDFLISSELFWDFFRGYFLFPRRKGKILRTYRLILPKYHLILPRKFFLPSWKIKNIPMENRKYPPRHPEDPRALRTC